MTAIRDTSFTFLYTGSDSSSFFYNFISRQDEIVFPWANEGEKITLIQQQQQAQKEFRKSLFSETKDVNTLHSNPRITRDIDWITSVLIFIIVLFTWISASNQKRMGQIFRASFSFRFVNQLLRDGDLSRELLNTILSICFVISSSLLIVLSAAYSANFEINGYSGFVMFLKVLAFTTLFFIFRILLHRIAGVIFITQSYALEYNVNSFLINHIIIISTLPLIIAGLYTEEAYFLFIAVAIYCLLFIYGIFRGSLIGISITKFSVFYLFLYLCTLEILPLLVIFKVVEMRFF